MSGGTQQQEPDWALVGQQYQADDVKGFTQVLTTLGPLAALWCAVAPSAQVSLWLTAAVILAMVLFLCRAFVLLHECGHGSLFRTARLNRAFGFVFGIVAGMPQFVWSKHHAYHHATNGNWAKYGGPLNTRSVDEFRAMTARQQRRYERVRNIWLAPIAGFLYLIFNPRRTWLAGSLGFVAHALKGGVQEFKTPYWNDAREYWHMFWNNVVLLGLLAVMAWLVGPMLFLVCYVVSLSLAGGAGIVLFTVQHNFEHSYASAEEGWDCNRAALLGTSMLVLPRWLNWFTANIGFHHVHHLSARVPFYRLAACHAEHQHLFQNVTRLRLSQIPAALKCVLWDTRARRIISVLEYSQQSATQTSA
jgi:omega-6 fatty acid desaturase (delta-12 desaturase)